MNNKVLVIDDSPLMREMCKRQLRPLKMEVIPAANGHEALELLNEHTDLVLVLLDLHLPAASGMDLLASVRTRDQHRNIPVILLSLKGDEDDVRRGIDRGAAGAVSKYENLNELPGLVCRVLHPQRQTVCC